MLTLTLLRHAKSSWDDEAQDDFDRPLAPRGIKAAPLMGQELASRGPSVDHILCSTALRARQTLDLVLPAFATSKPPVDYDDALYHALPEDLFAAVRGLNKNVRHVVLVGHNPGLEILAVRLLENGAPEAVSNMTAKYPTAAMAQFNFDISAWRDLQLGSGQLIYFLTPRTLNSTKTS